MTNSQHIKIFDTTLRDGQQCPGAAMSFENNIEYAQLAADANIDVIEAGFPAASKLDFNIVNTIAKTFAGQNNTTIVAALCQLREQQIDTTIESLQPLVKIGQGRLHTYLPVDPNLMRVSLGAGALNQAKLVDQVYQYVKRAIDAGLEVEFSPEGYSRMGDHFNFVTDLIRAAISAGATVINCPDTIGGACRLQGEHYFVTKMKQHAAMMKEEFADKDITWSAHCHNDFGLALENSMEAVFNGPVTQVEACVNSIGERAGNTSLEQCVMYIKHFGALASQSQHFHTQVIAKKLQALSDFVAKHMLARQAHWPITGGNAAKHSAGGHTNAILKDPLAYQPFDPNETGKEISFVFGPMSGGNHAKSVIESRGFQCNDNEKADIAQFIKQYYADRRKGITDEELMQAYLVYRQPIRVDDLAYTKKSNVNRLRLKGQFFDQFGLVEIEHEGQDSVLATLNHAISSYMSGVQIEKYQSQSAKKGISAATKSTIIISTKSKKLFTGMAEDHDIEIAALKAYIDAINQAYVEQHYTTKKEEIGDVC